MVTNNKYDWNSKTASAIAVAELATATWLPPSKVKQPLFSFKMTEIRNGRMVKWRWVPKETVVAKYVPQSNHMSASSELV